jgi:hypothetical protein
MIPVEILCSAAIGFAFSIILINFGSPTAPPAQSEAQKSESTLHDDVASNTESGVPVVYLDEETVLKRSKFLQESLGLSSETIKEAVRQTNEELREEPASTANAADSSMLQDTSLGILSVFLDYLVFGVVLAVCLYAANTLTHGELWKMLAALFRTELESIKLSRLPVLIKEYFNIQDQ